MRVHLHDKVKIGRDVYRQNPIERVNPSDVSDVRADGVRYLHDGALVGLWRSLRGHRVAGNVVLEPGKGADRDVFAIEPSWDGSFVPLSQSAATFAENQSNAGYWIIASILLAYDTSHPRFLWRSRDASPAKDTDAFVVILTPYSVAKIRALANVPESGG